MIPSIDYLTLVVAGALLVAFARTPSGNDRLDSLVAALGCVLFSFGTVRAFMGALGL